MPKVFVFRGKTGSGKSLILQEVALLGYASIDLEALALHRGSAFGSISHAGQNSQNYFEENLYQSILCCKYSAQVFVEEKPKNLGKLVLPIWYLDFIKNAQYINLDADLSQRLANISTTYSQSTGELQGALNKLKTNLSAHNYSKAQECLKTGNIISFYKILLEYYDQSIGYSATTGKNFTLNIGKLNAKQAAQKIIEQLKLMQYI